MVKRAKTANMYKTCLPSLLLLSGGSDKPLGTVGVQWGRGGPEAPAIRLHCRWWAPPSPCPEHGTQMPPAMPQTMADLGTCSDLRLLCLRHFLLFEESELIKTTIKTQQSAKDPVTISIFHKWHHSFNCLLDIITWMFNNVLNLTEGKILISPKPSLPKDFIPVNGVSQWLWQKPCCYP